MVELESQWLCSVVKTASNISATAPLAFPFCPRATTNSPRQPKRDACSDTKWFINLLSSIINCDRNGYIAINRYFVSLRWFVIGHRQRISLTFMALNHNLFDHSNDCNEWIMNVTYIVPFLTVILRLIRTGFGLDLLPYCLNACRTDTAFCCRLHTVPPSSIVAKFDSLPL